MKKEELIEVINSDTTLPYIEPWALKQIVDTVWHNAQKDAAEKIRNWERDFDDCYLTFDICGYARIMQTDLKEDMIKVINGEEV